MARLRGDPWAVAAAGLAETAAVSAPRGLAHNLVYLIYSINHHDGFCHLFIQAPVSLNDVVQNVSNSPSRYKVSLYEETAYLPASTCNT